MNSIDYEIKAMKMLIDEMKDTIENQKEKIKKLEIENQDIKDTLQDKLDYIGHLENLCDKYEEEHKTTFEVWQKDLLVKEK